MHSRSDDTSTTRLFLSVRTSSRQFPAFVRLILAVCVLPAALHAQTAPPYDRDDYLPAWADNDGDCQNTRQEVLIAESRAPVLFSTNGCTVLQGLWEDPYTGLSFTNPADVDIDHMVPLKEAHDSGAALWSTADKRRYANDLDNPLVLIAVDDGTNSSKGDKDPARWMPPNVGYHCEYVRNWVAVKAAYALAMDELEASFVATIMDAGSSPDPVSLASARFGQDPAIPTPAGFAIGMARAAGCGYVSELSIVEAVTFTGILSPDPAHIGLQADLFVVDRVNLVFTMMNTTGAFVLWTGNIQELIPFAENVTLTERMTGEIFSGTLSDSGDHRLFLGYLPAGGTLIYTPEPVMLNIRK